MTELDRIWGVQVFEPFPDADPDAEQLGWVPPSKRKMFVDHNDAMNFAWDAINNGAEDVRVRLVHKAEQTAKVD